MATTNGIGSYSVGGAAPLSRPAASERPRETQAEETPSQPWYKSAPRGVNSPARPKPSSRPSAKTTKPDGVQPR